MKFLLLLIFNFAIQAQADYKIENVEAFDLNRNDFLISIKTENPSELLEILKGNSQNKIIFKLNDTHTEIYPGSAYQERKDLVEVFFNTYKKIPSGEMNLSLSLETKNSIQVIDQKTISIPENDLEDKQPSIIGLNPMGGVIGDTVTIQGKNFGNNLDNIQIFFFDKDYEKPEDLDPTEEQPVEYIQMRAKAIPFAMTSSLDGIQHVHFTIPTTPYIAGLANEAFFRKSIQLKIYVKGRPSSYSKVTILPTNWKLKVIGLSLLVTITGIFLMAFMLGKLNFIPYVLIDKNTNTYSLSRFQAFAWTVVLSGSYFYIAIAFGILLQNGKIPDFNPSLVGLMTISYSGLIASHFVSGKKPKNEISHMPARISDLFMENSTVNITRLQLLIFNVITMIIYLYNLFLSNVLNGLPEIPPTLHGLLLSSQTGYIGGKILGDKISVNRVNPSKANINQSFVEINLIGSGFVNGTKIMIEGSNHDPVDSIFSSNTMISCNLPLEPILGFKNLIIIPPTGSSTTISNAIEMIETPV
jgi:hypothetical protein